MATTSRGPDKHGHPFTAGSCRSGILPLRIREPEVCRTPKNSAGCRVAGGVERLHNYIAQRWWRRQRDAVNACTTTWRNGGGRVCGFCHRWLLQIKKLRGKRASRAFPELPFACRKIALDAGKEIFYSRPLTGRTTRRRDVARVRHRATDEAIHVDGSASGDGLFCKWRSLRTAKRWPTARRLVARFGITPVTLRGDPRWSSESQFVQSLPEK